MNRLEKSFKATLVFVLLATVFLSSTIYSAPLPVRPKKITDDETVYALFSAEGKPEKTIVIDWLRLEGKGLLEVIDYGEVTKVEALKDGFEPEIKNDKLIWKINVKGVKDFYYRAETKKELPVELKINYFLNDKKLSAKEIAGRDGRFKIEIVVRNKIKKKIRVSYLSSDGNNYKDSVEEIYLPLLVIVNLDLKAAKFHNIEAEKHMLSVSGETMKYTWMLFPQPEDKATIEMDGKDIETNPSIVSILPQMPETPLVEIEKEFEKLKEALENLGLLSSAQTQVVKGLANKFDTSQFNKFSQATGGLVLLAEGIKKAREGTNGLAELLNGQLKMLKSVIAGIDTSQFESLTELNSALQQLLSGFQSSKEGIDGLVDLLQSQISVLEELKESNDNLISLAQETASTELVDGLTAQSETIEALLYGGNIPGQGYLPGLNDVKSNLENISQGLDQLIRGLQTILEQAAMLNQIPEAFNSLKSSLKILKDGGNLYGTYLPGLSFTLEGLNGISGGLKKMEKGFSGMSSEMGKLEDLPGSMIEIKNVLSALAEGGYLQGHFLPGLNTVAGALNQTSKGLGEGLEETRKGKAIKEAMENEAENYDTFLGKPNGSQGRVRFILKVEGIEK